MPGETDVINQGLREIGATPIVDRTDGSPSANTVDDVYDDIRDDLLRSHNWNFATKRVKLARTTTDPAFEFDYAYALPADWLRTISVHENDAGHGAVLHRMELIGTQRCIVASSEDIWLRYVAKITDPNLMATDFRRALAYSLAEALAIPLASSNTLRQQMESKASRKLASARSADAQGAFPELRPKGSWASSRGGRYRDTTLND
jgi:hypothetical protein